MILRDCGIKNHSYATQGVICCPENKYTNISSFAYIPSMTLKKPLTAY